MAETNANEKLKQYAESAYELPPRIEQRLADLVQLGEFDQGDVEHCRRDYWGARGDWHTILIDCYHQAQQRMAPSQTNKRN
jgi:hypothetical protein